MILSERFDHALGWAAALHRNQQRKGTGIPYVAHLLGVASIALENGCSEDEAIAALLHDSIEDQGVTPAAIMARFGPAVAAIVVDCTDDAPGADRSDKSPAAWRARKELYLKHLAQAPEASLRVSLADKTHNARAIIADLAVLGEGLWERFKGGRPGSLWYYGELARIFADRLPGAPSDRFVTLVETMRRGALPQV